MSDSMIYDWDALREVMVAAENSRTVQSMRAAKSCWNAVRQRQMVAWSDR